MPRQIGIETVIKMQCISYALINYNINFWGKPLFISSNIFKTALFRMLCYMLCITQPTVKIEIRKRKIFIITNLTFLIASSFCSCLLLKN